MAALARFIVLTNGRSGSNLLVTGLQQHPEIRAYGELLAEHEYERRRDASGFGIWYYREGEDVIDYLSRVAFSFQPWAKPKAVGFKMLYNHARKDKGVAKAWQYLIAEKDIHIVHLVRRNLFECCVSHEVAYRTNVWARDAEDRRPSPEVPSFRIGPQKCKGFIMTMLRQREWAFEEFKDHPQVILEYEKDLCKNYQKTMNRVFRFLGVPNRPVEKALAKQGTKPAREQVSNFLELRRFFTGTDYDAYFR
jgi:LPS sulfotransferase NodH